MDPRSDGSEGQLTQAAIMSAFAGGAVMLLGGSGGCWLFLLTTVATGVFLGVTVRSSLLGLVGVGAGSFLVGGAFIALLNSGFLGLMMAFACTGGFVLVLVTVGSLRFARRGSSAGRE